MGLAQSTDTQNTNFQFRCINDYLVGTESSSCAKQTSLP